ncbi:tRNA (N6-isopentenyl adenosine(37)-C2)-methylthiotransferase MiaB [Mycoplasmatota bacterium]|nr:tRNA (N6-isopentenyl adenosine(37)-C2)-methylthiotransferase MiaB [Mycoplasmatota bacterium]
MKDYGKYFKTPSIDDARKRVKGSEVIDFKLSDQFLNFGKEKKYVIQTYGCQGNEADSERMSGILEKMSFTEANDLSEADIILLNTCAIRGNAENRVFGEMGRLKSFKRNNPNLLLGVCGCMPQEESVVNKLLKQYPYVDLIFGTHNIHKIPEYLYTAYLDKERVVEVYSSEGDIVEDIPKIRDNKHKAWINIMYGCDEFCTYCIVPYTRGRERSRKPAAILAEVVKLVEDGYQEITLLGQNVNAYGQDLESGYSFADLLRDLNDTGINRIRFTTSHPRDLNEDTIKAMADCDHVMEHLHLPVQSGSDSILKKMNRKYTREDYLKLVKQLKAHIPDISITTDIIVGFPNESEDDFLETLSLVKEVGFEGAFTFIYSKREGTPAAKYEDDVPEDEKKRRLYRLNDVTNDGYLNGNKRFENTIVEVLVDSVSKNDKEKLSGYSRHNKLVNFTGNEESIGKIVKVRILEAKTWHLLGEEVN